MQYSLKPYVPIELRRMTKFLMIELIVFSLSIFTLMIDLIFFSKNIANINIYFTIVFFFILPILFYKWVAYLIDLVESGNFLSIKLYALHIAINFLLLISSYFAIYFNFGFSLFLVYLVFLIFLLFLTTNILLYRKIFLISFSWSKSKYTYFSRLLQFSFLFDNTIQRLNKFYIFFIIFFIHITVFLYFSASKLTIDSNLINLLPEDFHSVVNLKRIQKIFGASGFVILMIETDEANKEKIIFQKENNLKLINKLQYDKNQIVRHNIINTDGSVSNRKEAIVDYVYYNDSVGGKLKENIWRAKLTRTKNFINSISEEINSLNDILYCDYVYPIDFIQNNAILFESIDKIALFYARAKKKYRDIVLNNVGFGINLENNDYISFFENILDDFSFYNKNNNSISEDGYYIAGDNKTIAVFIKPKYSSFDLKFNKKITNDIKKLVDNKLNNFRQISNFPNIKVSYLGRYQHKIELTEILNKDIRNVSIIAFIFIIFTVVFYFRRFYTIFLISVPIIISIIWTFGIISLIFGYVNLLTGFLSIILMGLGIDFAIHLLSRFYEEKEKGASTKTATYLMIKLTFKPSFIALLTTMVAFFILSFSNFKGFHEFGFIGVFGLFTSYISMLYILPILIILFEKLKEFFNSNIKKFLKDNILKYIILSFLTFIFIINIFFIFKFILSHNLNSIFDIPLYYFIFPILLLLKLFIYIQNKYLSKIFSFSFIDRLFVKPKLVIIIFICIFILALFIFNKIEFDYDFSKIGGQTDSSVLNDKLTSHFNMFSIPSFILAYNNDEELEIYNLYKNYKLIKKQNTLINHTKALSYYIPKNQEEKIELIKELTIMVENFQKYFNEKKYKNNRLINLSVKINEFKQKYLDNIEFIYKEILPYEIQRNYKNLNDLNSSYSLIHIFPYFKDMTDGKKIKEFTREVRNLKLANKWVDIEEYQLRFNLSEEDIFSKILSKELKSKKENNKRFILLENRNVNITGANIIFADILFMIQENVFIIVISIFILCFLIIYLDFRKWKFIIGIFAFIMSSASILLLFMYFFNMKVNIFNVVVLPLILGIIIDSGIHFYHRYISEGLGSSIYVIKTTGFAIFLACLTSILGFSSLLFAKHYIVNSIGLLAIYGIISGFISSFLFLPSFIIFNEKKHMK